MIKRMDSRPGCPGFVALENLLDPNFLFCKRGKMIQYPLRKVIVKIKLVNAFG